MNNLKLITWEIKLFLISYWLFQNTSSTFTKTIRLRGGIIYTTLSEHVFGAKHCSDPLIILDIKRFLVGKKRSFRPVSRASVSLTCTRVPYVKMKWVPVLDACVKTDSLDKFHISPDGICRNRWLHYSGHAKMVPSLLQAIKKVFRNALIDKTNSSSTYQKNTNQFWYTHVSLVDYKQE